MPIRSDSDRLKCLVCPKMYHIQIRLDLFHEQNEGLNFVIVIFENKSLAREWVVSRVTDLHSFRIEAAKGSVPNHVNRRLWPH